MPAQGLPRRRLAPLAAGALLAGSPAFAQPAWKPGRSIEIVVGTNPGTGFDRTARVLQSVWKEEHLIDAPVTVLNKPGGAGVIAYHYIGQRARVADELTVIAPLLLTNYITHTTSFDPKDLTPLSILLGEEIVIATSRSSSIASGRAFADAIKRDPASVSIALSGIGGQNHVTVGLVGRAVGADIAKLRIVGFEGSGEAVTSAMGDHVDIVVAPASSVAGTIASGRMRGLGIASEKRLGGDLASVPTWVEQGIPVTFTNWRGIGGPKAMSPEQVAYWDGVFGRTVRLKAWQDELARSMLNDHYLDSAATREFLVTEEAKLRPALRELGLVH
jgi:putative tricarboxylic transport membrane protein